MDGDGGVFEFSVAHRMVIPRLEATVDSGKLCLRTIHFSGSGVGCGLFTWERG
jgi:hypothetical protein